MSDPCDIGRLVVRKQGLMDELAEVRHEIKTQTRGMTLPFAVEIDGKVVTVKAPLSYRDMPITSVIDIVKCG